MSKYYKAEDITELINAGEWRMTLAKERHGEGFVDYSKQVLDVDELNKRLYDLPTIEVSEDCISREYLEEQLQQIEDITAMAHIDLGEDPYDETEEITMPISTVRKIFKNAPSVLPKVNKDEWVEEFSDDGWRWVKDEL